MYLKRKIYDSPENFRKASKKFNRLFRFFKTEEGKKFLAMQGTANLKELIAMCQEAHSLADSHEFWEFVENSVEEWERIKPDWARKLESRPNKDSTSKSQ